MPQMPQWLGPSDRESLVPRIDEASELGLGAQSPYGPSMAVDKSAAPWR